MEGWKRGIVLFSSKSYDLFQNVKVSIESEQAGGGYG